MISLGLDEHSYCTEARNSKLIPPTPEICKLQSKEVHQEDLSLLLTSL